MEKYNPPFIITNIMLDMNSRDSFRKKYLNQAIKNSIVKMSFSDNPTSKNKHILKIN